MGLGAAMATTNAAKSPTPVVNISGMKNAITAIQTLTRPTVAEPANRPTSRLSECRGGAPAAAQGDTDRNQEQQREREQSEDKQHGAIPNLLSDQGSRGRSSFTRLHRRVGVFMSTA